MTVLLILGLAIVAFGLAWRFYSRFLARQFGEDLHRPTPATVKADGKDYVPTSTAVVFAHHFASIAGAGPIIGPVLAVIYGWKIALLWVVFGGVFIGAVHDYLATYIATREGGQSIASTVRRLLGPAPFIAITLFLVVILGLVCAAFLNLSATALTSMLPFDKLGMPANQTLFRVANIPLKDGSGVEQRAVIGGIASMSVICITAVAPLIGWMYLKRKTPVWICSLLAIGICCGSVFVGLLHPVSLDPMVWKLLLSAYVLLAAGLPVWIFLQSRDFINVHILYIGMAALVLTLLVAGVTGAESTDPLAGMNAAVGAKALGVPLWPGLFITIACGAVSGFHSLCAGGTTCKQLTSETAARRIGYGGMLLESFLAVCIIAVMLVGMKAGDYVKVVHPSLLTRGAGGNPVLGFALAVGTAMHATFGIPIAVGAVGGMVLLEGFLVTTLDTAIRLTRYLIEEIWRTFFGSYDVFTAPVKSTPEAAVDWAGGDVGPVGADGLPATLDGQPHLQIAHPTATRGAFRGLLQLLNHYWLNSALAVGLMLVFAFSGGVAALWGIFATSNQLLAAMVLSIGSVWLLQQKKRCWFIFIPAVLMLVTTTVSLVLMFLKFLGKGNMTLMVADCFIAAITLYLLIAGVIKSVALLRKPAPEAS